jgi:hypothetical protein
VSVSVSVSVSRCLTGSQGLTEVSYEPVDDESLALVASLHEGG